MNIFIAYSRKDNKYLNEIIIGLKVFQRNNLISKIWYDGLIDPGNKWEQEILNNLNDSQIILLLISANFINSDYAFGKEMSYAIELHKKGKANVIPIILKPCLWQTTILGQLQALPRTGKPIASKDWFSKDEAYTDIFEDLRLIIDKGNNRIRSSKFNYLDPFIKNKELENLFREQIYRIFYLTFSTFSTKEYRMFERKVKLIIANQIGIEYSYIMLYSNLQSDLYIDDLNMVEIRKKLSKRFDFSLYPSTQFNYVHEIIEYFIKIEFHRD